VMRRRDPLWR